MVEEATNLERKKIKTLKIPKTWKKPLGKIFCLEPQDLVKNVRTDLCVINIENNIQKILV